MKLFFSKIDISPKNIYFLLLFIATQGCSIEFENFMQMKIADGCQQVQKL